MQNVQKQETDLDYAIWFNFCQKNEIRFLDKNWTKQKELCLSQYPDRLFLQCTYQLRVLA